MRVLLRRRGLHFFSCCARIARSILQDEQSQHPNLNLINRLNLEKQLPQAAGAGSPYTQLTQAPYSQSKLSRQLYALSLSEMMPVCLRHAPLASAIALPRIKPLSPTLGLRARFPSSHRRPSMAPNSLVNKKSTSKGKGKTAGPPGIPATLTVVPGATQPLGPSLADTGVNFAVAAPHATSVALCLFDASGAPVGELPLHRDDASGVWHGLVPDLPPQGVLYGLRVDGEGGWESPFRWDKNRVLLDPYARYVVGRAQFGVRDEFEQFEKKAGSRFLGTFDLSPAAPFDWGSGYARPANPEQDLVILELPVRSFTAHPSSGLPAARRGTFLGLADKVDHLVGLGVNAVELLPVFEYDELEFQRQPNPREHMTNIWGYSHLNFFGPMSRFGEASQARGPAEGSDPVATAAEFKEMVKRLHAAGIEVILDVVYNHTAEADDLDPYLLSWRGIDAKEYYQQDHASYTQLLNLSGCGNTVAGNAPLGRKLIMDSLRWWVEEFHVDGFRFDLASCLCRDERGRALDDPPLIREIAKDPVLSRVKVIAEPWDLGMYQVGTFPAYGRWAEWNGKYRDDVRRFIRGDAGMKAAFATRLAGSQDLYGPSGRRPYHSVNFVIAHDGFTLADLVSYNEKHNEANGEQNRDGSNDNFTWNCGAEGPTSNAGVKALRARQMRNLHLALMLSQGTPMLLAGDEYAQTRGGNNNWYGHDSDMTQINWDEMSAAMKEESSGGWFRFYTELVKFRRECPLLGRADFLSRQDVTWHEEQWDDEESRFLAFSLHDRGQGCGDVYAAFNAHSFEVRVALPQPPAGKKWCRVVDTNLPAPRDYTVGGNAGVEPHYGMQAHSAIMLIAKDA